MTQVINDNVQTTLTIDGDEWLVSEAIVERSRMTEPDYVDMIIVPKPDIIEDIPDASNINQLVGAEFILKADNELISERATNAEETEEDTLLFTGNLGNISPTGMHSYEARAYDPSQQAFAEGEDGGSIQNTYIYLPNPKTSYAYLFSGNRGTVYKGSGTVKAKEVVEKAADALNIPPSDREITLQTGGTIINGEAYGTNNTMKFDKSLITVKSALKKVRDTTKSEWWFDREGVFHFGPPEPTKHALRFITDADAGKTTPPYQSVRVIGSGAASQEGYARSNMEIEDKIVKSGDIVIEIEDGEETYGIDDSVSGDSLKEPVFEYKNLEISNDAQAQNTLESLASDLGEQQAGGKITVVGFPEIIPHDGVQMPTANPEKEGEPNYNPRQPMGGYTYGVYKVTHFLNGQDGFTTEIEVAGLTGVTKDVINKDVSGPTFDERAARARQ